MATTLTTDNISQQAKAVAGLGENDYIFLQKGVGEFSKITAAQLLSELAGQGGSSVEVADDLETDDGGRALSARQGVALKALIDAVKVIWNDNAASLLATVLRNMAFASESEGQAAASGLIALIEGAGQVESIAATYKGGTKYAGDSLTEADFTVTAAYKDGHTAAVSGFTVSPATLSGGANTITIGYGGKTCTVSVTGRVNEVEAITGVTMKSGAAAQAGVDSGTLEVSDYISEAAVRMSKGNTEVMTDMNFFSFAGGVTIQTGSNNLTLVYDEDITYSVTVQGAQEQTPGVTMHNVTNSLDHVTTSNAAAQVADGGSYTAVLAAENGYVLSAVSVSMGGVDITSTAYNAATGAVSIASVTGAVVITATAVERQSASTPAFSNWFTGVGNGWDRTLGTSTSTFQFFNTGNLTHESIDLSHNHFLAAYIEFGQGTTGVNITGASATGITANVSSLDASGWFYCRRVNRNAATHPYISKVEGGAVTFARLYAIDLTALDAELGTDYSSNTSHPLASLIEAFGGLDLLPGADYDPENE